VSSIYGLCVTLYERGDALAESERLILRDALREQTTRMRRLIEQLLDLSRFDRGHAIGSGLGLVIAQAYARAHGGDIVYEQAVPHGARFELVIPLRAPERDKPHRSR
jgi:signal transduction histidine kinase